jgi:hypothetical protein
MGEGRTTPAAIKKFKDATAVHNAAKAEPARNDSVTTERRFPPPWTVVQLHGDLKVVDAQGRSLAYVYSRKSAGDATSPACLPTTRRAASQATSPSCRRC